MEVPQIAVLLVLAVVVGAGGAVLYLVRQRRTLRGECAAGRLAANALHRNAEALAVRFREVVWEQEVLAEADLILDTALAVHHRSEGGPA